MYTRDIATAVHDVPKGGTCTKYNIAAQALPSFDRLQIFEEESVLQLQQIITLKTSGSLQRKKIFISQFKHRGTYPQQLHDGNIQF